MAVLSTKIINHLQREDQEKIFYFINLLLEKNEYKQLAKEISQRRNEIKNNKIISHNDIWNDMDV